MKKNISLLLIISILVGTAYYLLKNNTASKNTNTQAASKALKEPRTNLKNAKIIISKSKKSMNSFPGECSSALNDLSAMTAEEYKDLAQNADSFVSFFTPECITKLKANKTFQEILAISNCNVLNEKDEKINESCLTMMFLLKAYFVADHTNEASPDKMSSEELAANFVKMFFTLDKLTKESFLKSIDLVNNLYERYPNDPDLLEAYLGYLMIGKKLTGETSVQELIDSIFADSKGSSFKVDRLQVLQDVLNDKLVSAKDSLDQLNEKYPKEADLSYYYAAYYWKQGNKEMADNYLDRALELSKNCSYCTPSVYLDTKTKLQNAKNGDNSAFAISIGLNFENL